MLPDVINGQAYCLYVRYALNILISLRECCRHIPYRCTTQAALNKGCLYSISWGISLKQPVTCVTISNKENVILKFELKL